jgi:hypothetical protein
MPITLPELTRREFLKRAALIGAATALTPSSYAGWFGKSRDKNTFAFFSDTHIAADTATVKSGVNMTDNFAACVRELTAWPVRPAAIIVNGDLALKDGQSGDYAAFAQTLLSARAVAPVHLNLGNHDDREKFWAALPRDVAKSKPVTQRQAAVFTSSRANWFLLDSLDKPNSTPGELGAAQIEWLARELTARPDKPAIIVGHHNLQTAGMVSGIKETPALEEIFTKNPQVKAYIFGHTHNWNLSQHASGVHLINLPPTGYVFKEGRPTGWVRCTLADDGAEFELRSLDVKHSEHAQIRTLKWRA